MIPLEREKTGSPAHAFFISHPPTHPYIYIYIYEREGGILESLCPSVRPSVCSSVCVSDHVHSITPEPLNHIFYLPNLVWWCIIMR